MSSIWIMTFVAMVAFAANSVLCRAALALSLIDPFSFTLIRILSGAVALLLIIALKRKPAGSPHLTKQGSWQAGLFLLLYATAFSWAYLHIPTATGALILFGAVQIMMMVMALWAGERFPKQAFLGIALALAGLAYLLFPGIESPPIISALVMLVSGGAWGVYTRLGKGSVSALEDTAANFCWAGIMSLLILGSYILFSGGYWSVKGVLLAVLSGAVASGIGYAIWYGVVPKMATSVAASVQLSVPVIAAFGGVIFVGEDLSLRLVLASAFILGGIALTLYAKSIEINRYH